MEIRLSPELEAVVERDMANGRYGSVEEYIAELVHDRELWRGETLEEFNAKLDESIAQAERGELADEEQVRQEMREMKAEWVKTHPPA
jgi:hypothetical protein